MKPFLSAASLSLLLLASAVGLSGCESMAHGVGDKVARFGASSQVGRSYTEAAAQTRFAANSIIPKRIPLLGPKVSERRLANGDMLYLHMVTQAEEEQGMSLGSVLSLGKTKETRYDVYAYRVDGRGKIIDYGHGRYNTTQECVGASLFGGSLTLLEKCGAETATMISSEVEGLVTTSSGQPLSNWR